MRVADFQFKLTLCIIVVGTLAGCVQTVDRPPIRLPQSAPSLPSPVLESRPTSSTGRAIDSAVGALAQDLMTNAPPIVRTKRIAILPMRDLSGGAKTLTATANDSFRVALFRAAPLQLVADNDMKRAIGELGIEAQLRRQGMLDRSVLDSLGKLLSAELIVDSQITDSFTDYRIKADIIESSTGGLLVAAQQLLPKSVLEPVGAQAYVARQTGRVLAAGDDWLQARLESLRLDNDRIVRAKFAFFNRSQVPVRLALSDPQRRAYLVDSRGDAAPYFGSEGLDTGGVVLIRPETRLEVEILFSTNRRPSGTLTLRTAWQASGTARPEQEFVVRDLVVGR